MIKKIILCFILCIGLISASINCVFAFSVNSNNENELKVEDLPYDKLYGFEKQKSLSDVSVKNTINTNQFLNDADIDEEYLISTMDIYELINYKCNQYSIPYDIAISISILETGWFSSDAYLYGNNPGGLSQNEIPLYFDTLEDGVDKFVSNLANNYFYIGLDTTEKIGQKYCPKNPNWANLVNDVMNYI